MINFQNIPRNFVDPKEVALEREVMKWYSSLESPQEYKWIPPRMLFYYWTQYCLFKK